MTHGRANDLNIGRLDIALGIVLMALGLLIDIGGTGGVRVVRFDGRGLDQRIGGLRWGLEVGVLVGIGAGGCSSNMLTMSADPAGHHSHLCITRYAAETAEKDAGDEGLSLYGLKADFNVGLGICGRELARAFNCRANDAHHTRQCHASGGRAGELRRTRRATVALARASS